MSAVCVFAVCVLCLTGTVVAQTPARLPPADKGFLHWIVGLGVVLLIAAAAFLNPKRTHQG